MNLGRMPNPLLNKSFLSQFPTFKSFRKKRKMLSLLVIRDQNHEKIFFKSHPLRIPATKGSFSIIALLMPRATRWFCIGWTLTVNDKTNK